jgi:hypothetical protein
MILKALTVVKGTRRLIGGRLHDLERIWHLRPFPRQNGQAWANDLFLIYERK